MTKDNNIDNTAQEPITNTTNDGAPKVESPIAGEATTMDNNNAPVTSPLDEPKETSVNISDLIPKEYKEESCLKNIKDEES